MADNETSGGGAADMTLNAAAQSDNANPAPAAADPAALDEIAVLTAERDAALKAAETLTAERDDALKAVEKLSADFTEVSKQRDDLQKDLAAAKAKAKVSAAPRAEKPREIGPVKTAISDEQRQALMAGGAVTIAFSDGKREIRDIDPQRIEGRAWVQHTLGALLTEKIRLKPQRNVTLGGFGLIDESGKQIGWCAMPTPMPIAAGTEVMLDRQIYF